MVHMTPVVSLEYAEGKIYAKLDAMLMKGEKHYDEKFSLSEGCRFNVSISSKTGSPIFPQSQFNSSGIDISLNFGSGTGNFFRADNQANHKFLHLHLVSGLQTIDDRIPFPENGTVYQIISDVFEKAKEVIPLHLPNFFSSGNHTEFLGFA
jgi:hypothetical protein